MTLGLVVDESYNAALARPRLRVVPVAVAVVLAFLGIEAMISNERQTSRQDPSRVALKEAMGKQSQGDEDQLELPSSVGPSQSWLETAIHRKEYDAAQTQEEALAHVPSLAQLRAAQWQAEAAHESFKKETQTAVTTSSPKLVANTRVKRPPPDIAVEPPSVCLAFISKAASAAELQIRIEHLSRQHPGNFTRRYLVVDAKGYALQKDTW